MNLLRPSLAVLPIAALLASCGSDHAPAPTEIDGGTPYTREQLLDPQTCNECHQDYFNEWSGSMHAYASIDPVFRAMNARGQRETHGDLGNFCVNCHAPMAVEEKATADGLNLDSVPAKLQGVTCYFCHNVTEVIGTHNNPLKLANDTTMRGGIRDPVPYKGHKSQYSELHDHTKNRESASLCGSCHDIVVPGHFSGATTDAGAPTNVAIERTYQEWLGSAFATPTDPNSVPQGVTNVPKSCGDCHMSTRGAGTIANPPNAYATMLSRKFRHLHTFAAIDTAPDLTSVLEKSDGGDARAAAEQLGLGNVFDFPNRDTQLREIRTVLASELRPISVCAAAGGGKTLVQLGMENVSAGHYFPSGASQDRRIWVEWHAYSGTGPDEHEIASGGLVPQGVPATSITEPGFVLIRDKAFKADGTEAHMFWDMAKSEPQGTIPVNPPNNPSGNIGHYNLVTLKALPDKVTVTVWLEPVGLDVLDDLIASEAPNVTAQLKVVRASMPRLTVSSPSDATGLDGGAAGRIAFTWTKAGARSISNLDPLCYDSTLPTL